MNNSKIVSYNVESEETDRISVLEKQQGEWTQIVEALNRVEASEDWQKLKKLLFDGVVASLESQLAKEASKNDINSPEIYRFQGQLVWARKYADLKKLSELFRKQVENINNQINGKDPGDGAP